ncbi:MAG TPA: hypothetical protein VH988_02930, partial [Thermoanaerobaculia bacterium]|nr:hypothetical protein [Thermoanaerobaculia bacterium]
MLFQSGIALLPLLLSLVSQSPTPGPPLRIQLDPNAIQDPVRPMVIEITGLAGDEPVQLQVLQDCDGDGEPDLEGRDGCVTPLYSWESAPAANERTIHDRLDFGALEAAGHPLPKERLLWIRASRKGSPQGVISRFGLVSNPCTVWQSVVDIFFHGSCNPGLSQALRHHRGPTELKTAGFEIRRLDVTREGAAPLPVPGTKGASGVAWIDNQTLAVTLQRPQTPEGESPCPVTPDPASNAPVQPNRSGLWRIPLGEGSPLLLWESPAGESRLPTAPLVLPGGRVAFVRQQAQVQVASPSGIPPLLSVWREGTIDPAIEIALPDKIHQLIASDAEGRRILALTLGIGADHPSFLEIDLAKHEIRNLGFDNALFQTAFRSPVGDDSVISYEDGSGEYGWDLVLVDRRGVWKWDLQRRRKKDDLLPSWRPDGSEIAFLAETDRPLCMNQALPPAAEHGDPETLSVPPPTDGERQLRNHVFERLQALLQAIPHRWSAIASPVIATPEWSAAPLPEDPSREARAFFSSLASSSLALRENLVQTEINRRPITEADLRMPEIITKERMSDLPLAALSVEAWLQLAEALGRCDMLLTAASFGIDVILQQTGIQPPLGIGRTWSALPCPAALRGRARLLRAYSRPLHFSGSSDQALETLKQARLLYQSAGDKVGQGNSLIDEARIHVHFGRSEE